MDNYYGRDGAVYMDGTRIFRTAGDERHEREIADLVAQKFRCEIERFGDLAPIDWYARRNGRLISVLELKSRTHERTRFPTVFLNVRKWLALTLGALGMSVPAAFFVRFTDGVWWVPLTHVDASKQRIGGCARIVKSVNDIEPVIEIPVETLVKL